MWCLPRRYRRRCDACSAAALTGGIAHRGTLRGVAGRARWSIRRASPRAPAHGAPAGVGDDAAAGRCRARERKARKRPPPRHAMRCRPCCEQLLESDLGGSNGPHTGGRWPRGPVHRVIGAADSNERERDQTAAATSGGIAVEDPLRAVDNNRASQIRHGPHAESSIPPALPCDTENSARKTL